MQTTDPALFACYILYVYFNGQNIARIEREMRSLGYRRFHRRNLYSRADKPGWIIRYGWTSALTGAVGVPPTMSPKGESRVRPRASRETQNHQEQKLKAAPRPRGRDALGSSRFADWLKKVSPNMTWSWRHQQVIIEQLERVTRGECKRLMIFLPPRHGKSELVTVRYTAWRMQRDPAMNVILGSYNQRLADRFSRKIRKVIADAETLSEPALVRAGLPQAIANNQTSEPDALDLTCNSQEGRLAPAGAGHHVRSPHVSKGPAGHGTQEPAENLSASVIQRSETRRSISRGEPSCSPFPFISSKPANSVSEWETTAGGGFRSVGVGSGVTGFGASLIVIDDPIKSRAEAESETYRERVWDWFTDDLYTRLEPDGAIVLIQTRWHEDDLAGRLLREAAEEGGEQWDVVNLPAIAERSADTPVRTVSSYEECDSDCSNEEETADRRADTEDYVNKKRTADKSVRPPKDWRSPGEPLCPERYDLPALLRIRRRLGEYSFAALYQQRPTPAEGGLFKREWFKRIIPFAPAGLKWKRGYDLAVSTKTNADYTASFRCAFDKEGNLYISAGFRSRLEYPDQRRFIIDRIRAEPDTEHGIELALHGQALIQDLRRERGLRGHLLRGVRVEHDKYTRALAWAPLAEEGKVILVRDPMENVKRKMENESAGVGGSAILHSPFSTFNWISDFLDEVCSFPSATHDDQVDAVSLAVQMLKGSGKRAWGF